MKKNTARKKRKIKTYEVILPYHTSLVYKVNATSKKEALERVKNHEVCENSSIGGRIRRVTLLSEAATEEDDSF